MKLQEAQIFWNDNRGDHYDEYCDDLIFITNSFSAVAIEKNRKFNCSAGACYTEISKGNYSYSQSLIYVLSLALRLITQYEIPYSHVHEKFLDIDEYKEETSSF